MTGEITFGVPQYENEYTYNGESYNPNIESQYLRARYYSVVTASFLTEDRHLGRVENVLTWNRYNYCVSSYLNYQDPSGYREINIPYEEILQAETFSERWDLVVKYSMQEFAEIDAEYEERKSVSMTNFYNSYETPGMQGFLEIESRIGVSGIYNSLVSPIRYAAQGNPHPFLEADRNKKQNSKYFYGGLYEIAFSIGDMFTHPERLTAQVNGTLLSVIENPELLTPDLMGMVLDSWDKFWEAEDEAFFTTSSQTMVTIATSAALAKIRGNLRKTCEVEKPKGSGIRERATMSTASNTSSGTELVVYDPEYAARQNLLDGKLPEGQSVISNIKGGRRSSGLPDWLKARFEAGNNFNKENRPRYPYNEVEVYGAGKNYVVDSYKTGCEIVSRKYTQLASVKESTGIGYLNELKTKYPSGAIITDSPFNPKILRGQPMRGQLILEIPAQNKAIPQNIIDYANKNNIIIRDVDGKVYN